MRSTLLTLTVLALIGGVGAQWWWYHEAYGPDLALRARDALKDNGVTEASVRLDYLDATLLGWAADEATRTRALEAIHLIRGLRVAEKGDQIHIQQRLESRDEPGQVILSGWLALPQSRDNLLTWLTALRPDLTFKADDLHVSPHVISQAESPEPLTQESPLVAPLLARLKVPASLQIDRDLNGFRVSGYLPDDRLAQSLLAALKQAAPEVPIDHRQLAVSPHVQPSAFATEKGLPEFVAAFFSAPTQASLRLDGQGARLEGTATREQESRWLSQLRPLTGGHPVDVQLRIYPSLYHLPGYQPQSQIDLERAVNLRQLLAHQRIHFAEDYPFLTPEERATLAALLPQLLPAGPGLRLIIAVQRAPADPSLLRPGLDEARGQSVRDYLIQLGLAPSQLSVILLDDPGDSRQLDSQPSGLENTVELLIQ
ncbi:MAG: hypothetical protein KDK99_16695 [Verrucomicrobiales bacterium]|nr:hypothetical protein [Verrucomicrobiales bacterium]